MSGKRKYKKLKGNLARFGSVGLDTNIFSYHFHGHPQFGPLADIIFNALHKNQIKAFTSLITLTELLSIKVPASKLKLFQYEFQQIPNLTVLDFNKEIALEAAKTRRKYGFRLPDAIQLSSAKLSKAKAFLTNDNRLKSYPGLKIILLSEIG